MTDSLEKRNILFLVTKSEVGGAQKYVKEQIDICVNDFNVYLAVNQTGWLSEVAADKVKEFFFDKRIESSRTSPGYLFGLLKFIKRNKIDLVVANSANAGLYGRLAARFAGISCVYVSHGWSSVYNGGRLAFLLNGIERFLGNISDKVLCVSENDYLVARETIKLPASKLIMIKNSIFPINKTDSDRVVTKAGKLKLLCVARFAPPKRIHLLIDALQGIDFADLYLVGTGPQEHSVKEYIEKNDLRNVKLLGEIQNFDDFISYDAFILVSDSEGLPISALEAMSSGLPLILSNVGGCKEIVVNSDLLVENSIEDIKRAISILNEHYSDLRKPVKPFFDANFNLLLNQDRYLDLYRSLIK
ncbi:glycosyltransferase [Chitinophaga ginsengisegetis]|uniref:glycosyltransferase n=1 Tax=Chitinophaga ginsengisegetis TaxID=393003 RepID=UPI000DB9F816|nr:glycosyltransferase [Chitinophaga ginsengisegetis]MDR6566561.1 glycosyltransferase involved in cell wall biosynthesis [Chitinophaga ginsengisegetis]MDR6646291.1 glycosyltransferase involved in cell wall biosynthesis [Chitinophaga ginsengisegetis]MDR6651116.1 glycosyltransferase involved in cell wall biosynthesis [Chitinophaga ginsengisegetis]